MIVAIERNKFTYLYKYNQIRIDINQILDVRVNKLISMVKSDFKELLTAFNKILPVFEQDHEILLLEVDKNKLLIQDGVILLFDGINCIYPLTKMGSQLIEGKINNNFKVGLPIFEIIIDALQLLRSMQYRDNAASKLLSIYALTDKINQEHLNLIYRSTEKNVLDKKKPQNFNTYLDHLIAYNKTPSFIPDGNIENICKIGAIAIKYLGKQEEVFTNGPFYKACLSHKNKINSSSFYDSYKTFINISDDNLKLSLEKVIDIISKDYKGIDIFKASYFFLAFKTYLNRNDNNLSGLTNDINKLVKDDENVAAFVLTILGYTFSFENIYESIHILSNANLFKSSSKTKNPEPKVIEPTPIDTEVEVESNTQTETYHENQLKGDTNNQDANEGNLESLTVEDVSMEPVEETIKPPEISINPDGKFDESTIFKINVVIGGLHKTLQTKITNAFNAALHPKKELTTDKKTYFINYLNKIVTDKRNENNKNPLTKEIVGKIKDTI